jgi:hypothetical protein
LDFSTGSVNFCVYPYTPFSGALTVKEAFQGKRYDSDDGIIRTQLLSPGNWTYSRYSNPGFLRDGSLYVYIETQGAATGDVAPKIWYTICKKSLSECFVDEK